MLKFELVLIPLEDSRLHRDGRANVECRDLGMADASDGRISAKHIRAIQPFGEETGWHSCPSQPAGVAHNVIGQSDDLELIEINMPADYVTLEMPSLSGRGATKAR